MKISINGKPHSVDPGITILEAIKASGESVCEADLGSMKKFIRNPLCSIAGAARIDGELCPMALLSRRPVREDMEVVTDSPELKSRTQDWARLLRDGHECHFMKEWQRLLSADAESAGHIVLEDWQRMAMPVRGASPSIYHDPNNCIRCQSCVDTCKHVQGVGALSFDKENGVIVDENLCVRCGQCIHRCPMGATAKFQEIVGLLGCRDCAFAKPLGAVREVEDTFTAYEMLRDPDSYCVVQFAPSIRASIGEEFGLPDGELVTGKLYAALRRLGFKKVWDTNFAADLTIMEEGSEFVERVNKGGALPQFTSCSPGWIRFVETFFPALIPNLSSAKSPQQMFGAMAKTFGAKTLGVSPAKMKVVSVMPCTAKKSEAVRSEMNGASKYWNCNVNFQDVDLVLTTREFGRLLKISGIDLAAMPEEAADPLLGEYTGAAPIFGRTGGVMEAALRTAVVLLTGKPPASLEFAALGEKDGIKRASIQVGGLTVKVAVAHGLSNARAVCESILAGGEFASYHFIEVMTCPGGCVGGGGQPIPTNVSVKRARTDSLNRDDREKCRIRMSHENPEIKAIYSDFLGQPLGPLSHSLLHTHYADRAVKKSA